MNKTGMKKVIVGCSPTGCYWLTLQKFLQDHRVQLVTVNPFTVNKGMELDDNSPEKSGLKDPKRLLCSRRMDGIPHRSYQVVCMHKSARALINRSTAFQDVFLYYRNREKNPLGRDAGENSSSLQGNQDILCGITDMLCV